jgi:hypothetical protein
MGYEVIYRYHEKDDSGNYNKEVVKEMKKKIGDAYEDVPLEKLASAIMSQLARRDIWCLPEVEIYEYKKSKISFRETKGGIVIKNKKFELDSDSKIVVHEFTEGQPVANAPINYTNGAMVPVQPGNNKTNLAAPTGRPIKWVALDPDERNLGRVKGSGLAFLPNKRYPVFQEAPDPKSFGRMIYTMLDENKREVTIFDDYFLNADQRLAQGFNSTVDQDKEPKLSFGDYEKDPMPDIRGR